jgi:CRISPR type I-E-associated protein CasB/Cse2
MTQSNQKVREPNAHVAKFITNLHALDAGEKARLKRDAGKDLSEARSLGLFYRLLPFGTPAEKESAYFLAATLFPLADSGQSGCLGDALRRVRDPDPKKNKGLDRRIEILLDSDAAQLAFRLRQAVRFLKSNRIPINWQELTEDVLNWNSPYRTVQKKWARAYFKLPTPPDDKVEETAAVTELSDEYEDRKPNTNTQRK